MIWKLQLASLAEGIALVARVPSLAPHRIVTGGVDDVHCGHVLIQEVTADGNRIATTAVVFLDGDTRGESGSCRTKTAPGRGGRELRASQHQWDGFPPSTLSGSVSWGFSFTLFMSPDSLLLSPGDLFVVKPWTSSPQFPGNT